MFSSRFHFSSLPPELIVAGGTAPTKKSRPNSNNGDTIVKGVKFSPDGLLVLAATEDARLCTWEMPAHSWVGLVPPSSTTTTTTNNNNYTAAHQLSLLPPARNTWQEAESINDYSWYPLMNMHISTERALFACATRGGPIHLWDALHHHHQKQEDDEAGGGGGGVEDILHQQPPTSAAPSARVTTSLPNFQSHQSISPLPPILRASYKSHNATDEIDPAICIAFSPDGLFLYSGSDHCVSIFDVSRSGRELWRYSTTPSRRSRQGQKGVIGAIAIGGGGGGGTAAMSEASVSSGVYAAGSYLGSVWLYDSNSGKSICSCKEKKPQASSSSSSLSSFAAIPPSTKTTILTTTKQESHTSRLGGVTQLSFSTVNPHLLFAGRRQSGAISCWDIRRTDQPVLHFARDSWTNQRITFDLEPMFHLPITYDDDDDDDSPTGKQGAGASGGNEREESDEHSSSSSRYISSPHQQLITGSRDGKVLVYDTISGECTYEMDGFPDAVNGVSFHPAGGVFACATGQRHLFHENVMLEDEEDDDEDEDDEETQEEGKMQSNAVATAEPTSTESGMMKGTLSMWRVPMA